MIHLFALIILDLNIDYNHAEVKAETFYSFLIPSNYSAYIISSQIINQDFQASFKNEDTKTYKGNSENTGHIFRVDSNEVILECK
jgi:hypothetical protein